MKLLNPYLTAGITADWTDYLLAFQEGGASGVEIGLPFSDPIVDGPTIQQASDVALSRGVTVASILADLAAVRSRVTIPLYAMTYANIVTRPGVDTFCERLAAVGFRGLIVPDLPFDEAGEAELAAERHGLDLIQVVAPVTPDDRLAELVTRGGGFIYSVSVMGTTGERATLAGTATVLAARIKAVTDRPVLIGFGISGPAQAAEAARVADGVLVGAALMRRVLNGATPGELRDAVAELRSALDSIDPALADSAHTDSVSAGPVVAGSVSANPVVAGSARAGSASPGSVVVGSVSAGSVVAGSARADSASAGPAVVEPASIEPPAAHAAAVRATGAALGTAGQDRAGQDRAGQDRAGQDRAGYDGTTFAAGFVAGGADLGDRADRDTYAEIPGDRR